MSYTRTLLLNFKGSVFLRALKRMVNSDATLPFPAGHLISPAGCDLQGNGKLSVPEMVTAVLEDDLMTEMVWCSVMFQKLERT